MRRVKDHRPVLYRPGVAGTLGWMGYWLWSRSCRQGTRLVESARYAMVPMGACFRALGASFGAWLVTWRDEREQEVGYVSDLPTRWHTER